MAQAVNFCNDADLKKDIENNEITLAAMDAAERGEVQGPFNSVEEMMEALNT